MCLRDESAWRSWVSLRILTGYCDVMRWYPSNSWYPLFSLWPLSSDIHPIDGFGVVSRKYCQFGLMTLKFNWRSFQTGTMIFKICYYVHFIPVISCVWLFKHELFCILPEIPDHVTKGWTWKLSLELQKSLKNWHDHTLTRSHGAIPVITPLLNY
jgi:hypothetical protein